jgi:DNA-binding MarR family transcriptional regulator
LFDELTIFFIMNDEEKIIGIIEAISTQLLHAKLDMVKKIKDVDLSPIHFQYIHVIDKLEKTNFTELSKKLQISKPTVTAFIDKLIKQEIIEKAQSDIDKRSYNIKLTNYGKEIAKIYNTSLTSFAKKLKSSMTTKEFNQLTILMGKALSNK